MDISGYLKRINYNGVVYRDLATLRELQSNHVFAIPFETLDIQNQIPIYLQINFLYQKVIHDRRGGYCYELNVLFHNLLTHCGFKVTMIGGRLHHGNNKYGREFEHMALLVELHGRKWLVDVGYGDFSLVPLALTPGEIQSDGRNYYQIIDPVVVDGRSYLGVAKWSTTKQDFKIDYIFRTIFGFNPLPFKIQLCTTLAFGLAFSFQNRLNFDFLTTDRTNPSLIANHSFVSFSAETGILSLQCFRNISVQAVKCA